MTENIINCDHFDACVVGNDNITLCGRCLKPLNENQLKAKIFRYVQYCKDEIEK